MKVLISYVVGEYPEAHHQQVAYLFPRILYVLGSSDK